jgi:zinc transport system substrate-binding protein
LAARRRCGIFGLLRTRIILAWILLLGAAGCGGGAADDGRPDVVAAFYSLTFAAERIGGGAFDVSNVTPPGVEPHDLELSAKDVQAVRSADVVLYLGSGFQPTLERAVAGADGEAVDLLEHEEPTGDDSDSDPHVWLDPVRFAALVERIGSALDRPVAAEALRGELLELDREFRDGLARCDRRELVTSHAAFGYLAHRYGLEQVALTGLSPEAEPGPRTLENVVREVRARGATTIFFEPLVSPELAETVARETGAKTAVLNPLEGLTQAELDAGEDYFSVMRTNLAALRDALDCE